MALMLFFATFRERAARLSAAAARLRDRTTMSDAIIERCGVIRRQAIITLPGDPRLAHGAPIECLMPRGDAACLCPARLMLKMLIADIRLVPTCARREQRR